MKNKKIIACLAALATTASFAAALLSVNNGISAEAQTGSVSLTAGASVRKTGRIIEGVEQEATPAIRFQATVTDATKDYGMIIVPASYVEALNGNTDYYGGLVGAGKSYRLFEYLDESDIGYAVDENGNKTETRAIRGALDMVKFDNLNKEFVAIVYEDTGAEKVYDTVNLDNARSVAYVSAAALNKGETGDILVKNVQNACYDLLGVDFADGVYSLKGNTYNSYEALTAAVNYADALKFEDTTKLLLTAGDTHAFATDNMKQLPVKYAVADSSIATVDENGNLQAVKAGTTTLTAYIGENLANAVVKNSVEVTVYSENDLRFIASFTSEEETKLLHNGKTGSFAYDETMGAAKYTYESVSGSWYDHSVGFSTESTAFAKFEAGRYEYDYMAFDIRFDGTGKQGQDFNRFLVFTCGTTNKTGDGQYYQSHFDQMKRYNEDGVNTVEANMVSGEWYSVYVPLSALTDDTEIVTIGNVCALLSFVGVGNSDGTYSTADYWLKNLRFEDGLPNYIGNNDVLNPTEGVGKLLGYGWTFTSAPEGATIVAGNEIDLSIVGDYVATNGTKTISFSIKEGELYAENIINPLNSRRTNDFYAGHSGNGEVVFDESMGAYKYKVKQVNTVDWAGNSIYFSSTSDTYKRLAANRDKYNYMVFDIYYEGTGGYGTDFGNFLVFMTGSKNNLVAAKNYYQAGFGEISIMNQQGVRTESTNLKSGQWYSVYLPIHHEYELNPDNNSYLLFAFQQATSTNTSVDFYLKNFRFEGKKYIAGEGELALDTGLTTRTPSWATVAYDIIKDDYKVQQVTLGTNGDAHGYLCMNATMATQYNENYANYEYFTFELCVDGKFGVDYKNFTFTTKADGGGTNYTLNNAAVIIKNAAGERVSASDMEAGVYYTVSVPTSGEMKQAWTQYCFMTQNALNKTEEGSNIWTAYWVRNFRFEGAKA